MQLVEAAAQLICRSGSERNGTNLSAKIPDAARINTHSTTSEKREEFRPFPFKGKARMGMGPFATFTPSPPQPSP